MASATGSTREDVFHLGPPWFEVCLMIEQAEMAPGTQAQAERLLADHPNVWPDRPLHGTLRMAIEMQRPLWLGWLFERMERAQAPWLNTTENFNAPFGWAVARVRIGEPNATAWRVFDTVLARLGNPAERHGHHLGFDDALTRRRLDLARRLMPDSRPGNAEALAEGLLKCSRDADGLATLRDALLDRAWPVAGDVLLHLRAFDQRGDVGERAWWSAMLALLETTARRTLYEAAGSPSGTGSSPSRGRARL